MPQLTPLPSDETVTDHGEARARLRIAPNYGINISASNPGYPVLPGDDVSPNSIAPATTMAGPHNADGTSTWGKGVGNS